MPEGNENQTLFHGLPENTPPEKKEAPKVELPEQLKGKSPEEMYTIMSQAHNDEMTSEINKVKAQFATAPEPKDDEGKGGDPNKREPTYTPGAPLPGDEETGVDFYSNPEGFMEQQFQKRMAPIAQTFVATQRESNRRNFARDNKDDYDKYGKDVEKVVDGFVPQIQADPRAYDVAMKYIKADHLDEIVAERSDKLVEEKVFETLQKLGIDTSNVPKGEGNQEPQTSQRGNSLFQPNIGVPPTERSSPQPVNNGPGRKKALSSVEKEIAAEFGLSEDDYRENKKYNTDVMTQINREA